MGLLTARFLYASLFALCIITTSLTAASPTPHIAKDENVAHKREEWLNDPFLTVSIFSSKDSIGGGEMKSGAETPKPKQKRDEVSIFKRTEWLIDPFLWVSIFHGKDKGDTQTGHSTKTSKDRREFHQTGEESDRLEKRMEMLDDPFLTVSIFEQQGKPTFKGASANLASVNSKNNKKHPGGSKNDKPHAAGVPAMSRLSKRGDWLINPFQDISIVSEKMEASAKKREVGNPPGAVDVSGLWREQNDLLDWWGALKGPAQLVQAVYPDGSDATPALHDFIKGEPLEHLYFHICEQYGKAKYPMAQIKDWMRKDVDKNKFLIHGHPGGTYEKPYFTPFCSVDSLQSLHPEKNGFLVFRASMMVWTALWEYNTKRIPPFPEITWLNDYTKAAIKNFQLYLDKVHSKNGLKGVVLKPIGEPVFDNYANLNNANAYLDAQKKKKGSASTATKKRELDATAEVA